MGEVKVQVKSWKQRKAVHVVGWVLQGLNEYSTQSTATRTLSEIGEIILLHYLGVDKSGVCNLCCKHLTI